MATSEILEEIRENARWGRLIITWHARQRMFERSVFDEDLEEAIETAIKCLEQEDGTWRVEGFDMEGDELTLIIALEGDNVIITLF